MSENTTFVSPQTESVYQVNAESADLIVCSRAIENGCSRVRIQGNTDKLQPVLQHLDSELGWSLKESGDHISCVVSSGDVSKAINDAVQAIDRL